jgi:hypothetical protein
MIPKQFTLAGCVWEVVEVAGMEDLGCTNPQAFTISLRKELPKQTKEQTFCHELVHAIKFTMGKTDHDEQEVDAFGYLLHQFLKQRGIK